MKEKIDKDNRYSMGDNLKSICKCIGEGKDMESALPAYVNCMEQNYYKSALVRGVMEYYMLYEVISEGSNDCIHEANDILEQLQSAVSGLFLKETGVERTLDELLNMISKAREEVIRKMEVLTAYTDIFQIYEYVLNRMEYRFKEYELPDEDIFAGKLFQYIFSIEDNAVINDKLKVVLEQLPVRMTKGRFFQLLEDSFTLYEGSDKSSVNSYVYMLRTSSMLYEPEGMDVYFEELKEVHEDLKERDFTVLTEGEYVRLMDKIGQAAEQIGKTADIYVMVQGVLNALQTAALAGVKREEKEESEDIICCKEIFAEIAKLFQKGNTDIVPEEIESKMFALEGIQEQTGEELSQLESVLPLCLADYREHAETAGLLDRVQNLRKMQQLSSASLFMSLTEEADEPAEKAYIKKEADRLIEDLSRLFQREKQPVRRAVMSAVLSKIPVFFQSAQEIQEYIQNAVNQCRDKDEKMAVMEILEGFIREEEIW